MFTFTVQESVTINRPITDVFDFIADPTNDSRWCPAVEDIKQIAGNGSGPGTRYEMHHTPGGMAFDANVEITAYNSPNSLQWITTDKGHTIRGTYELETVADNKTRLTQTSVITFEGWLRLPGLFMKRFIARDVQKELGKQFTNLKQILETEEQRVHSHL